MKLSNHRYFKEATEQITNGLSCGAITVINTTSFALKIKVCPICKMPVQLRFYSFYFSKSRNRYRPQNYCNDCQKWINKKRAADYFQKHKQERLQYAKDYRANADNKEKLKKISAFFKVKYREELQDCYVADLLAKRMKVSAKDVREHPFLLDIYKAYLKLKRTIKQKEHEK